MGETVLGPRTALTQLVRGEWTTFWVVAPRLGEDGLALIMPHLRRTGAQVRVLTDLTAGRIAGGALDLGALKALRKLPGCELRSLPGLSACIYAAGPDGLALVTSAALRLAELEASYGWGALCGLMPELEAWWASAAQFSKQQWSDLTAEATRLMEDRHLGEEIARVGAFIRVSVRGTRRTRRLDPREFGAGEGSWGRAVRPVEVALYKLDEVVRAREDLERVLAENGLEWNGYYLVPRHFLEREWPRIFAARERQLRERLTSAEAQASLKAQLDQARRELAAFFGEIYVRVEAPGMAAPVWVDTQVTRVLTETVTDLVLAESGLEYRVLTMIPEDARSVAEMRHLLQDSRLRSVQLTFTF